MKLFSNLLLMVIFFSCQKNDVTPPGLFIEYPSYGSSVRSTIIIEVNVTDNGGIDKVDFIINDSLHLSDNKFPYNYSWNTENFENGEYTIQVVAMDKSGNSSEQKIKVKVKNGPGNYIPELIEDWNFQYKIDVQEPYVYAAPGWQGLWRKDYRSDESEWEYLGFSDTTAFDYGQRYANIEGLSVYGSEIVVAWNAQGLWRSIDGGDNWERTDTSLAPLPRDYPYYWYGLKRSPTNPEMIIALEAGRAIFLSEDSGTSWTWLHGPVSSLYSTSFITWHPFKAGEVWVHGYGGIGLLLEGFLNGYSDFGKAKELEVNLKEINDYNYFRVNDISFNKNNVGAIIINAASHYPSNGYYISTDGSKSWSKIENDIPIGDILIDQRFSNNYFIASGKNIYYSNDGLQTANLIKSFEYGLVGDGLMIEDNLLFIATVNGVYQLNIESIR